MKIDSWARAGLRLVAPAATLLLLPDLLRGVAGTPVGIPFLLGAVVALGVWLGMRRDPGWSSAHSLWVAAALWLATVTVVWRLQIVDSRGPLASMQRLESTARDTTRRFTDQVERLEQLIREAGEHSRPEESDAASYRERWRRAIAASQPRQGEGLALYELDGTLLSWGGHSMAADVDLIAAAAPDRSAYDLTMCGEGAHLFAARRSGSGLVVVSEKHVDLDSLLGRVHPSDLRPLVGVEFLSNPLDRKAYGALFSRKKPFHRPHGASGGPILNFPLRAGDGSVLAVATARDRGPREIEAAIAGRWQDFGVLGLAALLLLALRRVLIGFPSLTGTATLATASGLVWGLRWLLSAAGLPHLPLLQPLFDYRDYSSPMLGLSHYFSSLFEGGAHALHAVDRWSASPGDLFLTLAAAAAQAALLVAASGHLPRRPRPGLFRRAAGWGAMLGGALAAAGLLYALVRSLTHDAGAPLLDVDLHDPNRAALFLQMCLFTGAAALALVSLALWRWAGRCCLGWRERTWFPSLAPAHRLVLLGVLGVTLVTLLYYPLLILETESSRRSQIASLVLPRIQEQESRRELALRESQRKVLQFPDLAGQLRDGADAALAYRVWSQTELASQGYESSLRLVDAEGRVVSRFGLNVPEAFEHELRRVLLAGPGPGRARVRIGGIEKVVLFSRSTLVQNGELAGGVEIVVPEGYDNIPFVFSPNPYTLLFRAQSAGVTRAALHGAPAHFSVYDAESHQSRFSTDPLTPPPLPFSLAARLAQGEGPLWRTVRHGRQNLRLLYAQDGNDVYAVGYQGEGAIRLAAGWLQSAIQNVLFATGLALALALAAAPAALRRLGRDLRLPGAGRTFYRRLLVTLLLASLIPLAALTVFLEGLLAHEIRQEVQRLGSSALAVASRVVTEAALLTPGGRAKVNDNLLYWLSQVIRQDIHIYRGPDLEATSRRELFASGLLPERLSGEVERALGEERLPAVLLEERPGSERFYVISARLDLPPAPDEGPWTLSLPLGLQQEEVEGKLREVREAVLLTIALLVLLLALLSYAAASRIARPLADLARAAGRLAGGDLEVRVERRPGAEIEALIDVFNRMARAIRVQQDDLRARRDYIEKILLNATTGVVSCDATGRVVAVNPSARLLTGADLAPGRMLRPALAGAGLAGLASLLPPAAGEGTDAWAAGVSERRQEIAVGTGQEERRLRAVLVPLRENERPAGGLLLLEDITETVRSNRLRAWAEMAQRIAHEIKNPLTPIQLSAEHLRHVYRDRPEDFGRVLEDCLRTITEQVHALRQLAREFSTYARIPEIRPERVDLREVVEETVGPYAASAPPELRIERDWGDQPLPVRVDRSLLRRALVNLLENSLEAMERKGTIRVRLHAGSENGRRQATLVVDDNGPGIDPAILPRLFEPFFSTKGSGTGLGLAIARQAVEANGGVISVERPDGGRGTRMVISLPLIE